MSQNRLSKDDRSPTSLSWHASDVQQVVEALNTSISVGLSTDDAGRRRLQYGPNTLHSFQETCWYHVLGRQFTDVLIMILLVAAAVSAALGEVADAITILAIILLNALLGFVQEWKAERAVKALREMLTPRCHVVRDGQEQEVEAMTLVPGDIVLLETGDHVPADIRIVQCRNLKLDESTLTGESVSVAKQAEPVPTDTPLAERRSVAWMGTSATNGRALGVVVATGMETEFGRIASLTESIGRDTTPLQRQLNALGRQLGIAAIGISTMIAIVGWSLGKPLMEMFLTGISLAVAVVPEGLPAVVTLTMAIGIRAMVRRRVLLRQLRAAEGLGAATVVCTDKTGTLTQNQMTVQKIWMPSGEIDVTGLGYDPAGHFEQQGVKIDYRQRGDLLSLLETGCRCNHARLIKDEQGWHDAGEPTESALLVAAYKAWLDPSESSHLVCEFSFNSTRKRMTVVEQAKSGLVAHTKGAPEVVAQQCTRILDGDHVRPLNEQDRQQLTDAQTRMANGGLRTLALARRNLAHDFALDEQRVETEMTLLGVVGMLDPPRIDVPEAIRLARSAGIRILMITGDSAATALAIGRRVGLPVEKAVTGGELEIMSDLELRDALREDVVFARTTPEHKLRIVNILQDQNHVVGMTGDGVNDAPALKKADIGIAMGKRGTDVAKGAADIVLTDDNFSSIIGAIEEGRRQFDNIQKFVRYLLSSNAGEVIAIFANIVIGGPLILIPVQILWMNLITDGMTAVALGLEPAEKNVMRRPPRSPSEPVLNGYGIALILALGSYVGLATLALFHYYPHDKQNFALAQTVAFTGIILVEKANVLNFRAFRSPLTAVGLFSNPWILLAIALSLGLQVCAVYVPVMQTALHTVPLGFGDWGIIVAMAAPIFLIPEIVKWFLAQRSRHSSL